MDVCTFTHTFFRYDQKVMSLGHKLHSNHFIAVCKVDSAYSHGVTSCCSYVGLIKADTLTILRCKNDFLIVVCEFYFDQFIFIT